MGEQLAESLSNSSIYCENDANCAALAEHEWGAGRGVSDFVMVTLGTGIGGGVIADGRLVRRPQWASRARLVTWSSTHAARECLCGGHGCWERYASGGGLHRMDA